MALAHELFAQLRTELFEGEHVTAFARRLGYHRSHVWRMETGRASILPEHVAMCRRLRVPAERRAEFEAIIEKLGEVVAAEALARLEEKREEARTARRARDLARKAALATPTPAPAPDTEWLHAWGAAVEYLVEAETEASWRAAVEYLRTEAEWMVAVEILLAAELARRHVEETWQADWAAAVEYLQTEAVWRSTRTALLVAALIEELLERATGRIPSPSRSRATTDAARTPRRYRVLPSPYVHTGPFRRRALWRIQQRRARRRSRQPNCPRLFRWFRRRSERTSLPILWVAVPVIIFVLCAAWILISRRYPAEQQVDVYVVSQAPGQETFMYEAQLGEKRSVRVHRLIPPKPLKGQKVAPCDGSEGEATINDGCWYGPRDTGGKPCGSTEFEDEHGRCYRPVAAPNVPTSIDGGTSHGGMGESQQEQY